MEREWLKAELAAGRSIESIAREAGRHPSTVAYWVKKYGLRSRNAERHAARGGIDRTRLEEAVALGLSVREIAARLGVSYATVRHWLERYGLETQRAARDRELRASRELDGATLTAVCARHGRYEFVPRPGGGFRCKACRSEQLANRRRTVKALLVDEAGGACRLCGYGRSVAALHFHHLDPTAKEFHLGHGAARSLAAARDEARKCVLLCGNYHAEVEAGLATLSRTLADNPG